MNNVREKILTSLKDRHRVYLEFSDRQIKKDPHWAIRNPLKGEQLNEWIEYGINVIIYEMLVDRTKAEIEMSWIQSSYM